MDNVVPLAENSGELVRRFGVEGAADLVKLITLNRQGHSFYEEFFLSEELVEFAIQQAIEGARR